VKLLHDELENNIQEAVYRKAREEAGRKGRR